MSTRNAAEVRETGLDKFYTKPDVAQHCLELLGSRYPWTRWSHVIEPSAGNGSFSSRIPPPARERTTAIDIAPEHPTIRQVDFFTFRLPESEERGGGVLVVGNPPFGRVSSLAIRFFNHAATFADVIAFIVPRTFRRVSVQNKLDPHFHCVLDEDVRQDPCAFEPSMAVKCTFQVWERRPTELRGRVVLPTSHPHWSFLPFGPLDAAGQPTPPMTARPDFALRAYGGRCGDIRHTEAEMAVLRPKSWHWIKADGPVSAAELQARFAALDYRESENTARQNSIGRGELVRLYTEKYEGASCPLSPPGS